MFKCTYCNDSGKYKMPNDKEKFERIIDVEMEKGDFVNYAMAEERAYKRVGYTWVDCPFCNKE